MVSDVLYLIETMRKVLALITGIPLFLWATQLPDLAESLPSPGDSRPIAEVEMQSFSNIWKTDPPLLSPIIEQSFEVNLQGYGVVYFLSFVDKSLSENSPSLSHWIVDGGRVRRELPSSEAIAPEGSVFVSLDAVVFGELNFDGFTDVYTIATYATQNESTEATSFPVVVLYEQNPEDLSFQILEVESLELTARRLSTVAEVEEILRREMLFLP
ncbi:MAG: hypothetical protein HC925_01890 [Coleofasciculaceae cyanobacterium SM2_3_26]|nr:hypothetical protein [Coleofasciculaceae cyanobacterium SM2_3_26]